MLLLLCSCKAPAAQQQAAGTASLCEPARRTGTLPHEIREASGIAISRRHPGILWVHNDDAPVVLFAIDSAGSIKGRVRVPGFRHGDIEDIAVAPCAGQSCIYLGDIGDNKHVRTDRAIYRFPEPQPDDTATAAPQRFPFHLPGRSEDAEALFVMPGGTLYLVTKGRAGPVIVYQFPNPLRPDQDIQLTPVFRLTDGLVQLPDMVTGAGATSDGKFIVIRTYSSFQLYHLGSRALTTVLPASYDLQSLREFQGEGVDIRDDGVLFLVGERGLADVAAPISRVQCHLTP
ncbi:MAG TPA: hypothetical protein VF021_06140 [Longimicrobiales bacterium]